MLIIQTWDSVCIYGFTQNLRNEEQVAIIQASTVLSLAEKVRGCLELYTVWDITVPSTNIGIWAKAAVKKKSQKF